MRLNSARVLNWRKLLLAVLIGSCFSVNASTSLAQTDPNDASPTDNPAAGKSETGQSETPSQPTDKQPADAQAKGAGLDKADKRYQEAFPAKQQQDSSEGPAENADSEGPSQDQAQAENRAELNLFDLIIRGGVLMIPIGIMSVLVMVFAVERLIGLRKSRLLPWDFVQGLGNLVKGPGGLDPRLAYRLCQLHKCTAANVLRAALLKLGRPHGEVERAVAEARDREADLLYQNVRPIALAMAVTPLMGLLGTVVGMIQTFFVVSQTSGTVKVNDLAGGIYQALVTTVAGLAVAIPAGILAHYFEGRIQRLFRHIDDLMQSVMPQLERFEGKLRVTTLNHQGTPQDTLPETSTPQSKTPPPPKRQAAVAGLGKSSPLSN